MRNASELGHVNDIRLVVVQQLEQAAARVIAEQIAVIPRLRELSNQALDAPAVGSRVDRLLSDELGERAVHIAFACIAGALDHMSTMGRIVESGDVPPYSLFSLARTAHESALNAEWLMEPTLDEPEQIARGVGAQYDDYSERAKLETAFAARATGDGQLAVVRRATYMSKAHPRGFANLNAKGELIPARPLLTAVDLFNRYEGRTVERPDGSTFEVPGSAIYRAYSAYAHGKQWANMLGDMTVVVETNEYGHGVASIVASDSLLVPAFMGPIRAIDRALFGLGKHRESPV